MTIDSNLIEGIKIGIAVGVIPGVAIGLILAKAIESIFGPRP